MLREQTGNLHWCSYLPLKLSNYSQVDDKCYAIYSLLGCSLKEHGLWISEFFGFNLESICFPSIIQSIKKQKRPGKGTWHIL